MPGESILKRFVLSFPPPPFPLFLCLYEGGVPVSLILINNIRLSFKILTDFSGSGVGQKVRGLWRKPFFNRVKSGTRSSLDLPNLDSSVNTGLEVVCKPQNIRAPVLFGRIGVKIHHPKHSRSAISTFICVVYRFKSCT